jgi:MoaA/NifB/PqqE/SkfB family radical SAM enzyme
MALGDSLRLGARIGSCLWLRRRPFLLYLKPTPRCDCRCLTCNRWQERGGREEELSRSEMRAVLAKFRRAGCAVVTLWGGEPTLRRDLADLLSCAKELGLRTSMCTNGNTLARQADRIAPHLDVLLCSLDGHGALHDEMRGVKGIFERVVRGIEAAVSVNPACDVKIWASVHRRNLHQLEAMASLARELGAGIEFFPLSPIEGHNNPLLLDAAERAAAFDEILRLKRNSWPVRNPDRALAIMRQAAPFTCNFGQISIHVDHRGQVYSCENAEGKPFHVWGRFDAVDPEALYASEAFRRAGEGLRRCGHCSLPCVVELSGSLPRALAGMFFKSLD